MIGSYGLSHHMDIGKEPKDLDFVMNWSTYSNWIKMIKQNHTVLACYPSSKGKKQIVKYKAGDKIQIVEIEIAWKDSTAEMILDRYTTYEDLHFGDQFIYTVATLNNLYELKMSHRFLKNSPHFHKTMKDIQLMKEAGAEIEDWDFYDIREKETYNYGHPALNVKKDEFFKDESFYVYEHDDIHSAVKIGEYPAYKDILSDNQEVKCSLTKWMNLSDQQKLNCALEECYVLSLERGLIPNDFKTDPKNTFDIALMKVCTSITSGWFREWCYDNYHLIKESYNGDYIVKFKNALQLNLIRNFKEGTYNVQ
jgi:hypothetical protein